MEELIRRSEAIEAIEKEECLGYVECQAEWIYDRIKAIPSADRWIPCSERLPSDSDDVLITIKGNDFVSDGTYAGYYSSRWWYMCEDGEVTDVPILADVIAWMPLPEPWKGAEDETD